MKYLCDTCKWNSGRYCWDKRRPNVTVTDECNNYTSIIKQSSYQLSDNKQPFGEPLLGIDEKLKKKKK